jgi:uncharacterized phage-associated protein
MNKIKSYDMDYQTRERIQKLIRKIYFDQSQRKIKNMKKNNFLSSSASFKILNIKKSNDNIKINNNRYEKLMDSLNISKKMRSKSAYSRQESSKMLLPKSNNFLKSQSINYKSININVILNKNKENNNSNFKKRELINKSKNIRVNSACGSRKIKIYEENKELNRFFNKKYIAKRNYIKKLENRELVFQKTILRLKNTPKTPFQMYNKEIIRQNANESFNNKMTLLISTPLNWKENFSEEEAQLLIDVLRAYSRYSTSGLVDMTHRSGTPWSKVYEAHVNNVIPKKDIQAYFESLPVLESFSMPVLSENDFIGHRDEVTGHYVLPEEWADGR